MRYKLAVAAALTVACCYSDVHAQAFAPYGAFRGRSRYVEGPYRTRSHIRWGNGLTPVGGQVLSQLITTAGQVATDPGVQGTVQNLLKLRSAEVNSDLVAAIDATVKKNEDINTKLNTLNEKLGLAKLTLPSVDVSAAASPAGGSSPAPASGNTTKGIPSLRASFDSAEASIATSRQKLFDEVVMALANSDQFDGTASPPSNLQDLPAKLQAFRSAKIFNGLTAPTVPKVDKTKAVADFSDLTTKIKTDLAAMETAIKGAIATGNQIIGNPADDPDGKTKARIDALQAFLNDAEKSGL